MGKTVRNILRKSEVPKYTREPRTSGAGNNRES